MVKPVNIESKNGLARLLASENLWIQHRNVKTASFDLVRRILTFPVWKEMSSDLYTMLAGHEVGHALYSEKASVVEIGKRIDTNNPGLAGAYWNIVEDARIERMIKSTFPGIIRSFATAYKTLYERDFFGLETRDPNALPFIDRINIHFKIGNLVNIKFSAAEQHFVNKVRTAITQADAFETAKELYEFSKHEHTPPEQLPDWIKELLQELCDKNSGGDGDDQSDSDSEPSDQSDSGAGGDQDDEADGQNSSGGEDSSDGGEESESSGGGGEVEDEKKSAGNGAGQSKEKDSEGEGEGDEGNESKPKPGKNKPQKPSKPNAGKGKSAEDGGEGQQGKQAATGKEAAAPVDPGPPPDPITQRTFDHNLKSFNDDKAAPVEYVTLPKPNLDKILVPYQEVHAGIRKHRFVNDVHRYDKLTDEKKAEIEAKLWAAGEQSFLEFRKAHVPKVNYIFQQFMMKKQADRYKRTRQHKTGSLDPLRLHDYKISEDLFKTVAVVADDKNHGLLFVVDWSGSMSSSMAGTVEQLIMLCMFCQKANIPFEVYSLTTGSRDAFDLKEGDLVYADNFRMRCYLSSRMSARQFYDACVNLFMLMPNGVFTGGPTADHLIGCTPLDESIVTTIDLMAKFRRQTGAQIVNAIFMTDGDANTVQGYKTSYGTASLDSRTRYLIDDRKTHKVYEFTRQDMTPTLLKILRDRQDINVVGFYIGGHWSGFFRGIDAKETEKLTKQWNEEGFVIATAWGYNELYITSAGEQWRVKDAPIKPKDATIGSTEYNEKLAENFKQKLKMSMKKRVMLDRFVKMIA